MNAKTATHILAHAGVRYWEDATVNGVEDADGKLIPHRVGDEWRIKVNLSEGRVEDWPAGVEADVHYKVCDAGEYWLLGSDGAVVGHQEGYVPGAFLCHGGTGYGDYIILKIGSDGKIANYRRPEIHDDDWA